MTDKFSLIQQLNDYEENSKNKTVLPLGVKYQEYILTVEGQEQNILIPLRESNKFEQALTNFPSDRLDREELRIILRKFRGIHIQDKE